MSRCGFVVVLLLAVGAFVAGCGTTGRTATPLGAPVASLGATEGTVVDVRALGATGDGLADDTSAFLRAIEQAAEKGVPVFVPRGSYVISRPLVLEKVAVTGPSAGAWPADVDALPSILPQHRDGPAFHLLAGGGVAGLDITYRWDEEPTEGPPAILISGIGVKVRDTRIRSAWDGILADGENNVGRTNIENVFMVTPLNVGLRMLGTWDVPRLSNVEVWNTGAAHVNRPFREGVAFHLGMNDLIRMTDCFAFGYQIGYLFESKIEGCSIEGPTWGVMNGCTTDFCGHGIVVRGDHTLSITGGLFWNHAESLVAQSGRSRLRVSGSELKSNGAPAIRVDETDHVVVAGCSLLSPMEEHAPQTAVLKSGNVVLTGNYIESYSEGVVVFEGVESVAIQGNVFQTHGRATVVEAKDWDPFAKTFVPGTVAPGRLSVSGNTAPNSPPVER